VRSGEGSKFGSALVEPTPEGKAAFRDGTGENETGDVTNPEYEQMSNHADHETAEVIIPFAEVEQTGFPRGKNGVRGEEDTGADADPHAPAVGAGAEKGQGENAEQSSRENGGGGEIEGECGAVSLGEQKRDERAKRTGNGDDDPAHDEAFTVGGVAADPGVEILDADDGETVEVRGDGGHRGRKQRRHDDAGQSRRNVSSEKVWVELVRLHNVCR